MSAAATAAGYLYASGRLRGRAAREQEQPQPVQTEKPRREKTRVAVLPPRQEDNPAPRPAAPRKTPRIEYRRKRWTPE